MSAGTESLIRAIQTNDSMAFYDWLHVLRGTPDLDAGVTGEGITPLAVAAVMYSKAIQSDRLLAGRLAGMIEALMDAGANPLVRVGERFMVRRGHSGKLERRQVSEGRSVAEVCGGVLCLAMQAWFACHTADLMNTHLHRYHPAFIKTQQPVAEEVRSTCRRLLAAEERRGQKAERATAPAGPRLR